MFGPKPRMEIGQPSYNPYGGAYDQFLGQLQGQMDGSQPSFAEEEYKRRAGQAVQAQLAMARGRNPGMARQAAYAGAQTMQGLNQGATMAGLAERNQASQLYGNALQGANQADFQRGNANLQAQLAMYGMPSDWDKAMQAGVALGGAAMKA